ncbi:MAG: CAP domain-containing protein [Bacteroidota bacterium]
MRKYTVLAFFALLLLQTSCVEDILELPERDFPEQTSESDNTNEENISRFAQDALAAVNQYRRQGVRCGNQNQSAARNLKWNDQLATAALRHANDMKRKGFFAHQGSDGTKVGARVTATGYQWRAVGENIAKGYPNINAVMAAWKDSPGHCRNMMNSTYTEMGMARVDDIWVQVFAKK